MHSQLVAALLRNEEENAKTWTHTPPFCFLLHKNETVVFPRVDFKNLKPTTDNPQLVLVLFSPHIMLVREYGELYVPFLLIPGETTYVSVASV